MNSLHLPNIKLAIFDFDGAIADTSKGIIDSHKYTLSLMSGKIPTDSELKNVIGGNLLRTYTDTFGFCREDAIKAVTIYRKRYAEYGIHYAALYPQFKEMLGILHDDRIKIGIATLKTESFAEEMIREMEIDQYFDAICGMNSEDSMTKAELISRCIGKCGVNVTETLMIGDSENDRVGALEAGVSFVGATYGFGFKRNVDYDFITVNSPIEIISLIC